MKRISTLALAVIGLAALPSIAAPHRAVADPAPYWNGAIPLDKAEFVKVPSHEQWNWDYPVLARRQAQAGAATVDCKVTPSGALRNCDVVAQSDEEFGWSSLRLAKFFKLSPNQYGPNAHVVLPLKWYAMTSIEHGAISVMDRDRIQ